MSTPVELEPRSFRPAFGLSNPHLQTVWGRIARSRKQVPTRREILRTPDGDELILDHVDGDAAMPRVVFLHGLEGSSNSVYIQGMLREVVRRRASGTVLNFRACARDPEAVGRSIANRGRRLYHSGETSDLRYVIDVLARRHPSQSVRAIGVSLGGNVLLKYLGEEEAHAPIDRAATISVPYDLAAGARHLESGTGRYYVLAFLRSLIRKAEDVCSRHGIADVDLERGRRARSFYDFDDAVTAPLHGFSSADHYYADSSSLRFLPSIRTPVLCVSSEDDPFLPVEALRRAESVASEYVQFAITARGGHAGFVGGALWRPDYWAERTATEWVLGGAAGPVSRDR